MSSYGYQKLTKKLKKLGYHFSIGVFLVLGLAVQSFFLVHAEEFLRNGEALSLPEISSKFLTTSPALHIPLSRAVPLRIALLATPPGIRAEQKQMVLFKDQPMRIGVAFPFQAFGINKVEGIEVRFQESGRWSGWKPLRYEEENLPESELIFLRHATAVELRANHQETIMLTFLAIDHSLVLARRVVQADGSVIETGFPEELREFRKGFKKIKIISREAWGADEALLINQRAVVNGSAAEAGTSDDEKNGQNICAPIEEAYPGQFKIRGEMGTDDEGRSLRWPRQYSEKVKKIVIHHTAQTLRDLDNDGIMTKNDYLLAVRAIYSYHTVSRGWGDVGYHYLVDPDGNVYEGRSGGKDVIGAHVLCQNTATLGIAVLGNFEMEKEVPQKAFEGLVELTTYLADLYDINPLGKSSFRGEILPHIATHAEVGAVTKEHIGRGATQCPGSALIGRMSELRKLVSEGGIKPDFSFSFKKPVALVLKPISSVNTTVTLTNRGEETWNSLEIFPRTGKKPVSQLAGLRITPGSIREVSLPISSTLDHGNFSAGFKLFLNGNAMKQLITIPYQVEKPVYAYELKNFAAGASPLLVGEKREVTIELKNTGNFPWKKEGVFSWQLVEALRRGRNAVKVENGLTLSLATSGDVPVDESAQFSIALPVQKKEGDFSLELMPLVAEEKGLKGERIRFRFPVERPRFEAQVRLKKPTEFVRKGFQDTVELAIMNTSNFDWEAGAVWYVLSGGTQETPAKVFYLEGLATRPSSDFGRTLRSATGGSSARRQKLSKKTFAGVSITVPVQASYEDREVEISGTLGLELSPEKFVKKPIRKFKVPFTVSVPTRGIVRLNAELVVGQSESSVELKNTGNVPWYREGKDAIHLKSDRGGLVGMPEQEVIQPGESAKFVISLPSKKTLRRTMKYRFALMAGERVVRVRGGVVEMVIEGINPNSQITNPKQSQNSKFKIQNSTPPLRVLLTRYSGTVPELAASEIIRKSDDQYRGILEFRVIDGKPVVINELSLEDYMKGIAEEPESEDIPQEKRKVIAVLSRSYALHYLVSGYEKFPGKPYNASDDPASFQKYLGLSFEKRSPKWQQALNDTNGEVLMVDPDLDPSATKEQRVLRAAYFSCTEAATDGSSVPLTKTPVEAGWGNQEYFKRFGAVFASIEDPFGVDPLRQGKVQCGHQVGLSGYGATQMAKQGKSYHEIIDYYYQHVELKQW